MEVEAKTVEATGKEASPKQQRTEFERNLIDKITVHKEKIAGLLEKQGGVLTSATYRELVDVLELVAPLFDLLEPKGLSIYLTGLVNAHGAMFPLEMAKICKRFGVKRPPCLPPLPQADDSQLSAKKLERKREKERLAALFGPPPTPSAPYLDEKEKREKEQEERAKELAKTPLSALVAQELRAKQQRRRSTNSALRFNEGLGHLKKQVVITSPVLSRRMPTTTTTTSASIVPDAPTTPSKKRKPDLEADVAEGSLTPSFSSSASHTPDRPAQTPTEPSSEPPQKRRRTGGFAITRANPITSSPPVAAPIEPKTEPRPRTSGFAVTRATPMSPLAASPRPKRFGAITRTAASTTPLTVRATRKLFATEDSSASTTPTTASFLFTSSSSARSLFASIAVPPSETASSSPLREC